MTDEEFLACEHPHVCGNRSPATILEVLEDRYGRVSTVVTTSPLPTAKWHEWIGDPSLADAILDRLVNNASKVDLKGNSRRRSKPVNTN